ncbi:hypothetical protein Drorol1_Dr00013749 [Drosera rotundifolia]
MARAAFRFHAPATYSLTIIKFNGRDVRKDHMDTRNGVALFAHAAKLGQVYVLRELREFLTVSMGCLAFCPLQNQVATRELKKWFVASTYWAYNHIGSFMGLFVVVGRFLMMRLLGRLWNLLGHRRKNNEGEIKENWAVFVAGPGRFRMWLGKLQ